MEEAEMALLEVTGLEKWYGKRKVVDGVSFDVSAGEVVGLLGPNGAGKTTSFRMTTGQIAPQGGRVIFNGEDVTHLPMFRRARLGMGYLTQEQSIFRRLTIEKNLLAILEALPRSRTLNRKLTRAERWERTESMLTRFNLTHVRYTTAARASGGEKRRLEIARCLVCEPLLILLDEPFAAVDPKTTEDIRKNIRELAQTGIGILLTDHNVREVLKITDRSYLIKDGRVVTHGTPAQLINDPIAINEYLGTTFSDNTFGGMTVGSPNSSVSMSMPVSVPTSTPYPATIPFAVNSMTTTPMPATIPFPNGNGSMNSSMSAFLEQENLVRLVDQLRNTDLQKVTAAREEISSMGLRAIPVLLDALERRDPILRGRVYEILKRRIGEAFQFDAHAPEEEYRRQLVRLREWLTREPGHVS
jgi:lipopolysaccharide export system ATP-binding protein